MKRFSFQKLILFSLLLSLVACNTNKKTNGVDTEGCSTTATVKDFTGLDGCSLMIVLENGDKLLPVKTNDESFQLRDGQRIKLNYKEIEDAMSICMAEKASIEITCIELIDGKPIIPECFDTEAPMSVAWMKEIIQTQNPSSVQKYTFRTDGWAYVFNIKSKKVLYDCQGTLLCEHDGLGPDQCIQKYVPNQQGKVIFRNDR